MKNKFSDAQRDRQGIPASRPKRQIRENQSQPKVKKTAPEAVSRRGWLFVEDHAVYNRRNKPSTRR